MFDEFCKKVGEYRMKDPERILEAYKELWSNRSLSQTAKNESEQLAEAIRIELKDELTHPRTRLSRNAKYFLAIKRICRSSLKESEKLALIEQFNYVMEQLVEEDKRKS
ncbi:hypothetical protein LC085_16115 [Bacillus tianshenii]|uniref:hypothetical protein n=1 Tax=Sutcliffiella tianshenii TaxID=1463404 RepID=UPI001CD64567|nr:hypothetical protein [Bacillus tianshenii]MCA1321431.1 hypothetical protein [Bacillus tianshenii]